MWGERLTAGPNGADGARALLDIASRSRSPRSTAPACWKSPPARTAAACARPACSPTPGPGSAPSPPDGLDALGIAEGLADGELSALYLLGADPAARRCPGEAVGARARARATSVIAHAGSSPTASREHATVIFPAESYAEKEGTVTHPDGRIQRLRPGIAHPGIAPRRLVGASPPVRSHRARPRRPHRGMATAQLVDAVPFYAELTLEEIGGQGVRWQERDAARGHPAQEQLA